MNVRWIIAHKADGLRLGSSGDRWKWVGHEDQSFRRFDSREDAEGTIELLPHRMRKDATAALCAVRDAKS